MSLRSYILLALLGLALAVGIALFQSTPGYMDASYSMAGGVWLADGDGFNEQILWNYLDDPAGLPHPSHGYWMPLASLLAALGMWLAGARTFAAARLGFLLLAAVLPVLTARLSLKMTRRGDYAILAGIFAAIPGFYLPYLPTTESFGLYMFFGALFLLLLPAPGSAAGEEGLETGQLTQLQRRWPSLLVPLLLGGLSGLMHLTRADGILWLAVAMLFGSGDPLLWRRGRREAVTWATAALLALVGYLLVMGPWMLRNLSAFGSFLSPGGGHVLWITNYDELFTYPASLLTPAHWWGSGLGAILGARLWAGWLNLQTAFAVQGLIFLLPLILAGLWRLRRQPPVQAGVLAWMLTFMLMTLIFPYQGARGGFFHSGAALQPLLWAAAPVGLGAFLDWGARRRGWDLRQAGSFFKSGVVGLALILTILISFNRVIGSDVRSPAWDDRQRRYTLAEQALQDFGASPDDIVIVNDAPTFHLASSRQAISIPYGDFATLQDVALRYRARYLLLEIEQVQGETLYEQPGDRPGLHYLGTVEGIRLYEFVAF
jgi:hypothetical protein